MFCPKCGVKNPENGLFCRSCGTDLRIVSDALTGKLAMTEIQPLVSKKGKPINWESAFGKLFGGIAFVGVTIALANSNMGRGWWFWMLIPALTMIGAGLAQIVQIKSNQKANAESIPQQSERPINSNSARELPPNQTEYVSPAADTYKTGDLVPASVTENTTRHLKMDSEGETKTLPKSNL
jgi:hypothetical protein